MMWNKIVGGMVFCTSYTLEAPTIGPDEARMRYSKDEAGTIIKDGSTSIDRAWLKYKEVLFTSTHSNNSGNN